MWEEMSSEWEELAVPGARDVTEGLTVFTRLLVASWIAQWQPLWDKVTNSTLVPILKDLRIF